MDGGGGAPPRDGRPMNRRSFFLSLFAGGWGLFDEARGRPHYILDDISSLPESEIGAIAPVIRQGVSLAVQDGWLSAMRGPEGASARIAPMSDIRSFILGLFDGAHAISEISSLLESRFDLSKAEADSEARGFFAALAAKGVCHPMGEPGGGEPGGGEPGGENLGR